MEFDAAFPLKKILLGRKSQEIIFYMWDVREKRNIGIEFTVTFSNFKIKWRDLAVNLMLRLNFMKSMTIEESTMKQLTFIEMYQGKLRDSDGKSIEAEMPDLYP